MSLLVKKAWKEGKKISEFGIEVDPSTDTIKVPLKHPEYDKPLWTSAGAVHTELWKRGYEQKLIAELMERSYKITKRQIREDLGIFPELYTYIVSKKGKKLLEIGPFEAFSVFWTGIVPPWKIEEIKLLERSNEALKALNDYFTTSVATKLYLGFLTSRPIKYKWLGVTRKLNCPSLGKGEAEKILEKLIEKTR